MYNIYEDIKRYMFLDNNNFFNFDARYKKVIFDFLNNRGEKEAEKIFHYNSDTQNKGSIYDGLDKLRTYENAFKSILTDHRDHYIHSATVFVLGLAIVNSSPVFRELFRQYYTYYQRGANITKIFLFEWSLSACLHDIAYPFQMSLESFNKLTEDLLKGLGTKSKIVPISVNEEIYENVNLLPILKTNDLSCKDTATSLIAENIARHNRQISFETLLKCIERKLSTDLKKGIFDHGVFSAIIMLNYAHKLYKENSTWRAEYFYKDIVNSATAIFLHNFYKFSLKDLYGNSKFPLRELNPLAFLLFFCDNLSEWNRGRKKDDYLDFNLTINPDSIILKTINGSESYKSIKKAADLFDEEIRFSLLPL